MSTRRRVAVSLTGAVVAAGALVTGYTVTAEPEAAASATEVPTNTVAVEKGTVTQRFRISGTYGFDGSYTIVHRGAAGILTGTARAGSTVRRGGVLYRVDGAPVRLLYGNVPAYRDLDVSVTDGDDVRQLERNLKALGMDPDGEMTVDRDFTAATAAAVKRLQKKWNVTRNGRLTLGTVAFLAGEIRVTEAKIGVGASAGPDQPVLTGTTTRRVVTADLAAEKQNQIKAGDQVSVTVPGAGPVDGEVLEVGKVATSATDDNGNQEPATVRVVMRIGTPKGGATLDQASVQISLATARHDDVLVVPMAALLAAPGTGYRVRLASGAYADVKPGLYDDASGLVEVTGNIRAGDRVEVPAT
ncbi:peptidoglycan-binding protein [Actinoplanes flavus]|uniref:Efflux RND transporter periplasmic adaptor subunit n=1 Tax=Actinoplanes flavus TaxID=2820290 RepID=A0ABS3USN8_9ACTN|nr:efflux RND transporter periplasmic adaptor subunit [Actinoplanes flavus]MBO3741598.1 efflux RND transporter periplasmic adaptor subunit [Actinoplanes flavus]